MSVTYQNPDLTRTAPAAEADRVPAETSNYGGENAPAGSSRPHRPCPAAVPVNRARDHADMCASARFWASVAAVAAELREVCTAPGEDAAPDALAAWDLGRKYPRAAGAWEYPWEAFTHR